MGHDGGTQMGGSDCRFPSTRWSLLAAVRDPMEGAARAALNQLIQQYWKPVYSYLRRRGYSNEDAKDLTQEFFTSWLQRDVFSRADPEKGRLRSFMIACLDRFVIYMHDRSRTQRRHPPGGILSIHDLAGADGLPYEPADNETPEAAFTRNWIVDLMLRVARLFEAECAETGKGEHYELFRRCIIEPALEGTSAPALRGLGESLGLTEKQANNRLLTARRAYQRLLREQIRTYAADEEEVAAEIRDMFTFLAQS